MKIFLIGFMGAGKSKIGQLLAQRTGLEFVDLDARIEEGEGRRIPEIFSVQGETAFRELESKYLREMQKISNALVATGGGTPCSHSNMDWMNKNGVTIYLEVPAETLMKRLKNEASGRPLLAGKTEEELLGFIQIKLEERQPFYSQAQFVCHADGPVEAIVGDMEQYFSRFFK